MSQPRQPAGLTADAPGLDSLLQKIEAVRQKFLAVSSGQGLARFLTAFVLTLAVAMFADWMLDLPLTVRGVLLLLYAAGWGYITWTSLLRPLIHKPDDDTVALMMERARPELRTRLIASIQLARPQAVETGASPSLVTVLVQETETLAGTLDFRSVVPTRPLLRSVGMAVLALLAGLLAFDYGDRTATDLLRRVFLSNIPVPRKTKVDCVTGNRTIASGDSITIEALAQGIVPPTGKVRLQYGQGKLQQFTMEPSADNRALFTRAIENVQESFTYSVRLHDGQTTPYQITVLPRPVVTGIECQQIYPAYARQNAAKRALGDLNLLAGSTLEVRASANKPLKDAKVRLVGLNQDVAMQINPTAPTEMFARFVVPPKGLTGFSILLTDEHELKSKDEVIYRIDTVPDKPPLVSVTYPERKEELVTAHATSLIGFEASDDYGIGKVVVHFKVDQEEGAKVKTMELDLAGDLPRSLRRRYEWRVSSLEASLPEGTSIEYWLEISDSNDVTGPGVTVTEHYWAKVVTEQEKRADLMNRLNDYLTTVGDLANAQEVLTQNLGSLIFEKARPVAPEPVP